MPPRACASTEDLRRALYALPPGQRLALRRHPVVAVSIHCSSLVRGLAQHGETARNLLRDLDHTHALLLDFAGTQDEIDAARILGILSLELNRDHRRRRGLETVMNHASDLDLAFDLVLNQHDINHRIVLNRQGVLSHQLDLVRALLSSVDQVRSEFRDLMNDFGSASNRARALDYAHALDLRLGRVRDFDPDRLLTLARSLSWSVDMQACRTLGLPRGGWIGALLTDGVLDDFTKADLASVDMTGLDLSGVRWSHQGTIWPPGQEDRIRRVSQKAEPGSDIWVVIRADGADIVQV
ncbi:hypothetical protein [Streptacidiphilus sp. BW17]|uniref:hypothetical protein n=1 Tax=Streptacidiphilus sp. BW17 TaxID=3156274 RepID=UPI003512969B